MQEHCKRTYGRNVQQAQEEGALGLQDPVALAMVTRWGPTLEWGSQHLKDH